MGQAYSVDLTSRPRSILLVTTQHIPHSGKRISSSPALRDLSKEGFIRPPPPSSADEAGAMAVGPQNEVGVPGVSTLLVLHGKWSLWVKFRTGELRLSVCLRLDVSHLIVDCRCFDMEICYLFDKGWSDG